MREEWSQSCDVITFVYTGFGVYLGSHSKLKVRFFYVPLKLSHSNFNLAISNPYRTCPYGKFGFENVWLNVNNMCCGSL